MSRKKANRIKKRLDAKAEKKRLSKQKKKEKKDAEKASKEDGEKKRSLSEIMDTVDLAFTLVKAVLGCFFGHLRVDVAKFRIKVATGDPASTAIAYGAVSQTVSYLIALLKNNKNVKGLKRADIDIQCDFLSDTPSADIKLSFSLRVWHVLHIALTALINFIKKKVKSAKTLNAPDKNGNVQKISTKDTKDKEKEKP